MPSSPDLSRRNFLLRGITAPPEPQGPSWDDFFGSYEMACAQVNEARPFLAEEAKRLGIDTKGKSDVEILKAVFATTGRPQG
ncbi:MAG: hypothetical protein IPP91_14190 [Betaproteobacteria bacterium]|nr:hypothetical protein [Betaproteobacteria bacterium]